MNTNRRKVLVSLANVLPGVGLILQGCYYHRWEKKVSKIPKSLSILSPKGGETFVSENQIKIQWETENITFLHIELSFDGGISYQGLFSSMEASKGSAVFTIQTSSERQFLIKLSDSEDPTVNTILRLPVTLQPLPPQVPKPDPIIPKDTAQAPPPSNPPIPTPAPEPTWEWKFPLSTDSVYTYETIKMQWNSTIVEFVDVYYQTNGSTVWVLIQKEVKAAEGSLDWEVPSISAASIQIKAVNKGKEWLSDTIKVWQAEVLESKSHPDLKSNTSTFSYTSTLLGELLIFKVGQTFKIINTACTHSGCPTSWTGQGFSCGCHGAAFDSNGVVLRGPASSNLKVIDYKWQDKETKLLLII